MSELSNADKVLGELASNLAWIVVGLIITFTINAHEMTLPWYWLWAPVWIVGIHYASAIIFAVVLGMIHGLVLFWKGQA